MNRENTLKAVSCLCFSLSVITTTQVIMKLNTLSIPLMIASRGIFIVVANYVHRIIIERKSIKFYPNKYYLSLNLLGSLSMSLSNQLGFFSVRLIPMGVANIIFQTQILQCQFISYLVFSKPLSYLRIRNILISLLGIFFIFQPSFIFQQSTSDISLPGLIIALISSFVQAIGNVFMSQASSEVDPMAQTSYLQFGHIIWGALIQIQTSADLQNQFSPSNLITLIFLSVMTWISNFYYFRALQLQSAEKIAPIMCLHPIFSLLIDVLIFDVIPNAWTCIGFVIVLTATLSTIMDNMK